MPTNDKPTEMDAARVHDERDDLRSRLALQVELATLGTDIGDSLRLRLAAAEAEVTALRADLAKREAMRQVCYDKWQAAEDKLVPVKAELRVAQKYWQESAQLAESRAANAQGLAQKLAAAIARADRLAGFIHRHVVDNKTYEMSGDSYGQLRHAALAALAADSKDGAK
jgi:hypothetical protein